jgi:tetratricopeptide (TPR) repeat protein
MATRQTSNPVYYFLLGTIYGNPESTMYDFEKALGYYEKVIEIDSNHVDSYINIGGLYIEKSASLISAANELPYDKEKEYNAMINEAKAYDEQALPYVEKAYEMVPDDAAIKQALKTLYVRLKMMDKAKALEAAE